MVSVCVCLTLCLWHTGRRRHCKGRCAVPRCLKAMVSAGSVHDFQLSAILRRFSQGGRAFETKLRSGQLAPHRCQPTPFHSLDCRLTSTPPTLPNLPAPASTKPAEDQPSSTNTQVRQAGRAARRGGAPGFGSSDCLQNPNGIPSQSPGLRRRSRGYPGAWCARPHKPNGLASPPRPGWPQPGPGWKALLAGLPRVARAAQPWVRGGIPSGFSGERCCCGNRSTTPDKNHQPEPILTRHMATSDAVAITGARTSTQYHASGRESKPFFPAPAKNTQTPTAQSTKQALDTPAKCALVVRITRIF